MSTTDVIISAVRAKLVSKRAELDDCADLQAVCLEVRIKRGTGRVRCVIYSKTEETEIPGA